MENQTLDAKLGPILGLCKRPRVHRIGDPARVVIEQRHGLTAATNGGPLGKGSFEVPNGRTGLVDPAIDPRLIDTVVLVVVALEVLHDGNIPYREVQNITAPHGRVFGVVDFIDAPVVRLIQEQIQLARIKKALGDCPSQRQIVGIKADIDIVLLGLASGTPGQGQIWRHVRRARGRLELAGPDRNVVELHLAQTLLREDFRMVTPVAQCGDPHRLSQYIIHRDCRIDGVGARTGGLVELIGGIYFNPGFAVHRHFDPGLFDPTA